jgi:DNA-binding LacI/PurR family transcriptional regulator
MLQCAMRELGISEMAPLRRQKCDGQIALIIAGAGESSLQLERLLRGASEAASANCLGLNLQVCNDSISIASQIARCKADGLLLAGERSRFPLEEIRKLPVVWLMGELDRPETGDQILPDHLRIGELAARHLLDRGHRLLGVTPGRTKSARVRTIGFQMAAEEARASVEQVEVGGESATRATGIFVSDEQPFSNLRSSAVDRREVIYCGISPIDLDPSCLCASIDIRADSIGRLAVERLMWRLRNPQAEDGLWILIEPELVKFDSGRSNTLPQVVRKVSVKSSIRPAFAGRAMRKQSPRGEKNASELQPS